MVLAAGRGSRLRPLTDVTPKPLLEVTDGVRLVDWTLAGLKRAGITDVVMNTGHLPDAFEPLPAQLARRGIRLQISREAETHDQALESLGGIVRALPLLTDNGKDLYKIPDVRVRFCGDCRRHCSQLRFLAPFCAGQGNRSRPL